jgi:hypothetical protein
MTAATHTRWGPFVPNLPATDLLCRILVLRAFCQVFAPRGEPIHLTLWRAEHGEIDQVEVALVEFDALPALTIRNILGSYAEHWRGPKPRKPVKPERTADVQSAL